MQERIFTLKAGTEVAKRFDGATIPFKVPTTDAEIASLISDEKIRVAIFNQAYSLNLQKSLKEESGKEGATIESLRKHAAEYKVGMVRTKGPGTGKPRVSRKQVATVLGDDFLATLTPDQRKLYDAKMTQLSKKLEAPAAAPETQPAATEKATATPKRGR